MNVVVSTLFRVMCFSHDGRIVFIDQLSFVGHDFISNHPTSLRIPSVQVVSSPPQVNYVATYPIHIPTNEDKPFIVCSTSFDLALVGDIVHHLLGALDSDLSIGSFDMYLFQSVIIPSNQNLFESMVSWRP